MMCVCYVRFCLTLERASAKDIIINQGPEPNLQLHILCLIGRTTSIAMAHKESQNKSVLGMYRLNCRG